MYKLFNPNILPEDGDIWLVEISHILENWESGDGGGPQNDFEWWGWETELVTPEIITRWEGTFREKREDEWYDDVVASIRDYGFLRPVTARVIGKNDGDLLAHYPEGTIRFNDGHHRLLAAIDLRLTHIPVEFYRGQWGISGDCYSWQATGHVIRQNVPHRNKEKV